MENKVCPFLSYVWKDKFVVNEDCIKEKCMCYRYEFDGDAETGSVWVKKDKGYCGLVGG